jgi:hypothetical protein
MHMMMCPDPVTWTSSTRMAIPSSAWLASNFGTLSGALLVGNFGGGRINAYDPTTGAFLGTMLKLDQTPLVLGELWACIPSGQRPSISLPGSWRDQSRQLKSLRCDCRRFALRSAGDAWISLVATSFPASPRGRRLQLRCGGDGPLRSY